MNVEVLISWLDSGSSAQRLRGARRLLGVAKPEHLVAIQQRYNVENVPWVKNALSEVIKEISAKNGQPEVVKTKKIAIDVQELLLNTEEIQGEAIRDTIGQIIHELEPILGALRLIAREEIQDFENSETKAELERFSDALDTFESWMRVEQKPKIKEVDVLTLIEKMVKNYRVEGIEISINRDDPITISTDKSLLGFAISNGLRNAVESSEQIDPENRLPIVINVGKTDRHFWCSIIDHGVGLLNDNVMFYKSHQTTKPGHQGMGLPIAVKAIEALGGQINLEPGRSRGAVFYIEIPLEINL